MVKGPNFTYFNDCAFTKYFISLILEYDSFFSPTSCTHPLNDSSVTFLKFYSSMGLPKARLFLTPKKKHIE